MKNISKNIWLLVGTIFPILVGALHTFAHFKYLVTPEVQRLLDDSITIFQEEQSVYNTWGLVSFMMGISFIVIGIGNYAIYRKIPDGNKPPILALLAMIIYLISVIYAGSTFGALPQLYGGIFGIVMLAISVLIPNNNKV